MGLKDRDEIDITAWCIRLQPAAAVSGELRSFQDKKGRIDFGDSNALNAYNKAAFKVMADLEVDVPNGNLIPTACLRQAYLTILVDELLPRGSKIIEIGTGASAVISMLAAKNHDLEVIATEVDPDSFKAAKINIRKNKLSNAIDLRLSTGGILEGELDTEEIAQIDAILCYPPTYPEEDRNIYNQPTMGSGFMGTSSEMIGGGEDGYAFIEQYIDESVKYGIKYITVLCIFELHADLAVDQLKRLGINKIHRIALRAGTRERYLIVAQYRS